MKKRSIILLSSALALTLGLGVAGAITYAGFVQNSTLSQTAQMKRYLFLDADNILDGGGKSWEDAGAEFYIYAWTNNVVSSSSLASSVSSSESSEGGHWYKSLGKVNGYQHFYISTTYVSCIFVRMNPSAHEGVWDYDGNKTWGQTANLTITSSNNLYTITSWHTSDYSNVRDPAQGSWSNLSSASIPVASA